MIRFVLAVFILAITVSSFRADNFVDVWLTQDQQGSMQYGRQNYIAAARRFEDDYAKGLSYYAAEDFANAVNSFRQFESAESKFYRANAYAHLGQLDEAITSYNEALALQQDFQQAQFNLQWVTGLRDLDAQEYEDAGGTGGRLEADEIVYDDRAEDAVDEMTVVEMQSQGMSDQELQEMWMRRVQTTPGDFLRLKFSYQAANAQ